MSKPVTIDPFFVPRDNQIAFGTKDINTFQRATYADTWGSYQQAFGLYGYMKIDRMNKFIVHRPKGAPLMWQPLEACSYDPTRSLTVGKKELEPTKVYMNEEFCWDELFDSCFEHMIRYTEGGDVELDADATRIFDQLVNEMIANAQLGARASMVAGQLYDVNTVEFDANNPANINSLFQRTHGTVQGWLPLMADLAISDYAWLNTDDLTPDAFTVNGYQGDVVDLFDSLKTQAPRQLQRLVNQGGVMSSNQFSFRPLFVVSPTIFSKLIQDYNAQRVQLAQNDPRITKMQMPISGNGLRHEFVYMIDDTPVIPLDDICVFDDFVNADTHYAGIIASGNIQMGFSFAGDLGNIENQDIGIIIEQNTSITSGKYKQYGFLSHALMKVALADPNYAVGSLTSTSN